MLDLAALALAAIAAAWSFIGGPTATEISNMKEQMAGLGGLMGSRLGLGASSGRLAPVIPTVSISVMPAYGMLFLVIATVALLVARRRRVAIIPIVLALLAVLPTRVSAATPAAVEAYFKRAHPGCSVNTKILGQGVVRGALAPLQLVEFGIEGCPGAENSYSNTLVGVYERGRTLMVADAPPTLGFPETVTVRNGQVIVEVLGYGPSDAKCCPTARRTVKLSWSNGDLIEDR